MRAKHKITTPGMNNHNEESTNCTPSKMDACKSGGVSSANLPVPRNAGLYLSLNTPAIAVPRMIAILLTIPSVPLALVICLYSTNSGMMPSLTGENNVLWTPRRTTQTNASVKFPKASPTIHINASMTSQTLTIITTVRLLYLSENCPANPPNSMNGNENNNEMVACPPVPRWALQMPPLATPSMISCLKR